jgi:hypothetical protein
MPRRNARGQRATASRRAGLPLFSPVQLLWIRSRENACCRIVFRLRWKGLFKRIVVKRMHWVRQRARIGLIGVALLCLWSIPAESLSNGGDCACKCSASRMPAHRKRLTKKPTNQGADTAAPCLPETPAGGAAQAPKLSPPVPEAKTPLVREVAVKEIAAGGPAAVALAFAAFTFLYGALLTITGSNSAVTELRAKLRHGLYVVAATVVLSAVVTVLSYIAEGAKNATLDLAVIGLGFMVLLSLSGLTLYLARTVYAAQGNEN